MVIILSILLGVFVIAATTFLVIESRKKAKKTKVKDKQEELTIPAADCCGAHEICEYDELKVNVSKIEYYDDEELDQYKEIASDNYTDEQIDQFREVLYTLKTKEIRYWLLSIERRKINLPSVLMDEARMLMVEG